jgi:spore coat polysaccharide biosynthesis protein SpsF
VEVIRVEALERARQQTDDPDDLEHVTPYLYAHPEEFAMRVLPSAAVPGAFRFTLDTPEDLQRIELLVDRMTQPHWTYDVQALRGLANDE